MALLFNQLSRLGHLGLFVAQIIQAALSRPFYWSETRRAMAGVGLQCLIPILAVVGPAGMVVTLQGLEVFKIFGAEQMLSSLLAAAILRELGPTLTAIMLAAQAGSAISGEIGTMRVKEEIDALGVMAVNPIQYLIVPRLMALAIMVPLINVMACATGLVGGYLVAVVFKGLNPGAFSSNLLNFIGLEDIWAGMLKACVFGLIVGVISCYKGYFVSGGALGVGRAANETVVTSVLVIVVVNYFLTTFLVRVLG